MLLRLKQLRLTVRPSISFILAKNLQEASTFLNVLVRLSAGCMPNKVPVHPYTCRRHVSSDCMTPARLPEPGGQTPDIRSDGWRDLRVEALTRLVTQLQHGRPLKVAEPVAESRLQLFNWQPIDTPVACNVEPCTVHFRGREKKTRNEFEEAMGDETRKITGVMLCCSIKWFYERTGVQKFGCAASKAPMTEFNSIIITPETQDSQNNNTRHIWRLSQVFGDIITGRFVNKMELTVEKPTKVC